jgi:CRISPR-associated endonuclease/helicase Cas3
LVRLLIGTHHGWGRPFWPIVRDPENPTVRYALGPKPFWPGSPTPHQGDNAAQIDAILVESRASPGLERLDSGWTDSFWRMVRAYGPWGLAMLEAVLILADHERSRNEEEGRS